MTLRQPEWERRQWRTMQSLLAYTRAMLAPDDDPARPLAVLEFKGRRAKAADDPLHIPDFLRRA